MIDILSAHVLSELLAGVSVNGAVGKLDAPWIDAAGAILAAPIPTERVKALEAWGAGREGWGDDWGAIMAADPGANLDALRDPVNLADLPLTDSGNAEALATIYGERVKFDHRRRRWLVWKNHRWEPDRNGEIERLALETVRERLRTAADIEDSGLRERSARWALVSENRGRLAALVDLARSMHPITQTGDNWDGDPWLLGCSNGVIDLRNGNLEPGKPGDMVTLSTGIEYQPEAQAPRFERFLFEVFNGDTELIEFVQRAAGYSVTGDTREHKVFLCWGKGANGKSTLLNAIRQPLGDYATNTPFYTFELNQSNTTNDLAALCGLRFVTASETNEARRLNEARVKAITGGDPVTARFLFGEYFTYQPTFKIWLAMNHKPVISGTDNGIWRRIRLIPFTMSFEGKQDEKTLGETLRTEQAGILSWVVRGALKWQAEGLTEPRAVIAATEEYRLESDTLAQFFADCTASKDGAMIKAGDLYARYAAWCKENGEKELSGTAFGRRVKDRGIDSIRRSGNVWYLEIGISSRD